MITFCVGQSVEGFESSTGFTFYLLCGLFAENVIDFENFKTVVVMIILVLLQGVPYHLKCIPLNETYCKYMVHNSNKGFLPVPNDLADTKSKFNAILCWLLLMQ